MNGEDATLYQEGQENRYRAALQEARMARAAEEQELAMPSMEEDFAAPPASSASQRKISNVQAGFLIVAALLATINEFGTCFDSFVDPLNSFVD